MSNVPVNNKSTAHVLNIYATAFRSLKGTKDSTLDEELLKIPESCLPSLCHRRNQSL